MVTREFLRNNRHCIFVFGDNLMRVGVGGAASLRDEPNTYGFITKIFPSNKLEAFYYRSTYKTQFMRETDKLTQLINIYQNRLWLVSKVGSGLANKFGIYDIIKPWREKLPTLFNNVHLL